MMQQQSMIWKDGTLCHRLIESLYPAQTADYQSRKLEIRFGQKKGNEQAKQYVHLLNSTLTATERTMCCILENYQREDGVEIPEVLRSYMGGKTFMPFQAPPAKEVKRKEVKGMIIFPILYT